MKYNIIRVYQGQVTEEENDLSLFEVCKMCRLNPELIIEMVNEGILDPKGESKTSWRFSFSTVNCVRTVMRFQNDLGINLAGAALALNLLERIEELETSLHLKS